MYEIKLDDFIFRFKLNEYKSDYINSYADFERHFRWVFMHTDEESSFNQEGRIDGELTFQLTPCEREEDDDKKDFNYCIDPVDLRENLYRVSGTSMGAMAYNSVHLMRCRDWWWEVNYGDGGDKDEVGDGDEDWDDKRRRRLNVDDVCAPLSETQEILTEAESTMSYDRRYLVPGTFGSNPIQKIRD
jgi:hypothetical protein